MYCNNCGTKVPDDATFCPNWKQYAITKTVKRY